MNETVMIHDTDLRRYVWHGGPYIEIGPCPEDGEEFSPLDVINVWDYAKNEPTIPRTFDAFKRCCERADVEFEAQYVADDDASAYSELAEMLHYASAEGSDDFIAITDRAGELHDAGEIPSDLLERIEQLQRAAERVNAL